MNFVLPFQIEDIFLSLGYIHLFAIVLGIVATLYIDLLLSKLCGKGRITKRLYLHLRFANKVGIFGAMVLWSTLFIQITHFSVENPTALVAQELWARIAIVAVLSANLYLIRHIALPKAKRRIGLSIYGALTETQQNRMLAIGAISSISWIALLVLWLLGQSLLPISMAPTYEVLMMSYLAVLGVALLSCKFGSKWARKRFFDRLETKRRKYRKITRTTARRRVVSMFTQQN